MWNKAIESLSCTIGSWIARIKDRVNCLVIYDICKGVHGF